MKLPNCDKAIVEIEKLRDYCLNPDHPRGSGKARVFLAALGLARGDAEVLRWALLSAAADEDAVIGELDNYGQRYLIDFKMTTIVGTCTIRSCWIILASETVPRLTTCYVMKSKKGSNDGNE
jgi:hypothetical protein